MKVILSKFAVCVMFALGFYALARFLVISPALPTGLSAWGGLCFLFSGELAGRKRRIRNGLEDKPPLRVMWMIAGILCVLMAVGVLFVWA